MAGLAPSYEAATVADAEQVVRESVKKQGKAYPPRTS